MDFAKSIKQAINIIKLDEKTILDVSNDQSATIPAILIILIAGIAMGIGSLNIISIFVLPFILIILFSILSVIIHVIAKILGGQGSLINYYRAAGHISIINWISIIPIIGSLISMILSLWSLVVNVKVIKSVYKLSTIKAITVLLIPVIAITLLLILLIVPLVMWQLGAFNL